MVHGRAQSRVDEKAVILLVRDDAIRQQTLRNRAGSCRRARLARSRGRGNARAWRLGRTAPPAKRHTGTPGVRACTLEDVG